MVSKSILCLILTIILTSSCKSPQTAQNYLNESQQQKDERMAWWRDARFGMFIHWGLYAIPAGEYKGQKKCNARQIKEAEGDNWQNHLSQRL
jgi:alpha-L-fucosidase